MKSVLDVAEHLSVLHEKISFTDVNMPGFNSAGSDAEHEDDRSITSDKDISDSEDSLDLQKTWRDAQNAIFTKHLERSQNEDRHESTSITQLKTATPDLKGVEAESSRIIDQVRDYQQEMFERAKVENIIAV